MSLRLFVALNLPKKERQRIHRSVRDLREEDLPVRWVDPDHYHVTLKFLGDVHPDALDRVQATLDRVAAENQAFSVELGGYGAFPTIRKPRVLWLGVDPSPALRCLKQDLEWALADCGFERETRAFHPHLTLARADPGDGAGAFRGLDERIASMAFEGDFKVRTLDLMRTRLGRDGARYAVVRNSQLGS